MNNALDNGGVNILAAVKSIGISEKEVYSNWLIQTYFYLNQYLKLTHLAQSLIEDKRMLKYLEVIQRAERNKPLLLINELDHFKISPSENRISISNQIMFESQFYKVQQINPVSIFGIKLMHTYVECYIWPLIINSYVDSNKNSQLLLDLDSKREDHENLLYYTQSFCNQDQIVVENNINQFSYAYEKFITSLNTANSLGPPAQSQL